MDTYISINPFTNIILAEYPMDTWDEVLKKILLADDCVDCTTTRSHVDWLPNIIHSLNNNKNNFAELISNEMGKPISQSLAEIDKCIQLCQFYLGSDLSILKDTIIPTEYSLSKIVKRPLGVIVGIMPWNYPFWQVFRFAIPTILSGNTVLLKHAPNVTGCALAIEKIFNEALGIGIYQSLKISNEQVSTVISQSKIAGVSFTGSEKAGSIVASLAGKYIKKSLLELGGMDAFVIHKDIPMTIATQKAVQSRLLNSGQTCISAKRIFVHETHRVAFQIALLEAIEAIKYGDPLDTSVTIGPLARQDIFDNLKRQDEILEASCELIASSICTTMGLQYPVKFYEVKENCALAMSEELFGPIGLVQYYTNIDTLIKEINRSPFGLGASVWTNDDAFMMKCIDEIKVGLIAFNELVKSDPRLPFGGVKSSGYGRELGDLGLTAFINEKTIITK